jgi:hypothetical protein
MDEIKDPFLMFAIVTGLVIAPTFLIWGLVRLLRRRANEENGER